MQRKASLLSFLLFASIVLLAWQTRQVVPPALPEIKVDPSVILVSVTPSPVATSSGTLYQVTRVVDGDTIDINLEGTVKRVRLIGIDTPETVDPRQSTQCFGKEASAKTSELLLNKFVSLEKDVSETDRYGRLLRYIYVNGQMANQVLVAEGYARALTYPPDVKYSQLLSDTETQAQLQRRGLWDPSICPVAE